MKWRDLYPMDHRPSIEDMSAFIGDSKPYWDDLILYMDKSYHPKRQIDFSKDTYQPGWNVKFKKSGRTLCTFYPMAGYFIVLVVIGPREEEEVRLAMEAGLCTSTVQGLYDQTKYSRLGRWLMIEVKDDSVLKDICHLIDIRIKPQSHKE